MSLQEIVKKFRFDLPPDIDTDHAKARKLHHAAGEALTQVRGKIKKLVRTVLMPPDVLLLTRVRPKSAYQRDEGFQCEAASGHLRSHEVHHPQDRVQDHRATDGTCCTHGELLSDLFESGRVLLCVRTQRAVFDEVKGDDYWDKVDERLAQINTSKKDPEALAR